MPYKDPADRKKYQREYKRSLRGYAVERRKNQYLSWTNQDMAELTPIQREIAELYYLRGLTAKAIADQRGCHINTVKQAIQAIKKKIVLGVDKRDSIA
jgi:DNA-directed RNA polymerase specialized sigma24 family protein